MKSVIQQIIPEEQLFELDGPEVFNLLNDPEAIENAKLEQMIATAYHEAGHVVVATCLGAKLVSAYIQPTNTERPWAERHWIGQCSWAQGTDGAPHVVGIAGEVAEAVMRNEWDARSDGNLDIRDLNEIDTAHLTEENFKEASFRAHQILIANWGFVGRVAGELIHRGSLSAWEILQLREVLA